MTSRKIARVALNSKEKEIEEFNYLMKDIKSLDKNIKERAELLVEIKNKNFKTKERLKVSEETNGNI
jgi:hypothetical protein